MGRDRQQEEEEEKKKCVKLPEKEIDSAIRKVQDQDRKLEVQRFLKFHTENGIKG